MGVRSCARTALKTPNVIAQPNGPGRRSNDKLSAESATCNGLSDVGMISSLEHMSRFQRFKTGSPLETDASSMSLPFFILRVQASSIQSDIVSINIPIA